MTIKVLVIIGLIGFNIWLIHTIYNEIFLDSNSPNHVTVGGEKEDTADNLKGEVETNTDNKDEESIKEEAISSKSDMEQTVLSKDIKVIERSSDFIIKYESVEIDFNMNRDSIKELLGPPKEEESMPGERIDTYDYFYDDIHFSFFPQTGDLVSIRFSSPPEVLERDWLRQIIDYKPSVSSETIMSPNENTILTFEASEVVVIGLFLNFDGPSFVTGPSLEEEASHNVDDSSGITVIPHNSDRHLEILAREFVRVHIDPNRQMRANYSVKLQSRDTDFARVSVEVVEVSSTTRMEVIQYNVIVDVRGNEPMAISMQQVDSER